MARQLRIEYPGAIHHVTVRGNGQQAMFLDDRDREYFLSRVRESVETHRVRLYLFCLMRNHFHFVVETPQANLGRFMHGVTTGYGIFFNLRHHRSGHVTQGRYGARVVEGGEYLLKLSRYVHLNPVKIKSMKSLTLKDKVKYLRGYKWSSYPGYIGARGELKSVDYGPMLALMECGKAERRLRYREYVESGLKKEDEEFLGVLERSPRGIGGKDFREEIDQRYEELAEARGVREDVSFRREEGNLAEGDILAVVSRYCMVSVGELKLRRRDSTPRGVAAKMLCKYSGLTQREVARILGLGTGSAVSYQISKVNEILSRDRSLGKAIARIEKKLRTKQRAK